MKRFTHPATIIATVALFAVLGGAAYGAAQTLINGANIKNSSIPEQKLTPAAIAGLTSSVNSTYNSTFEPVGDNGTPDVEASLVLPAGKYMLQARTTVADTGAGGTFVCYLTSTTATLDQAYGALDTTLNQEPISFVAPLTTTGTTVSVKCLATDATTFAAYTHIVALKVGGSVTGTLRHSAAPNSGASLIH